MNGHHNNLDLKAQYPILRFFDSSHLKPELAAVVQPFEELAWSLTQGETAFPAERATALRKLLEAKDAAVVGRR